MNKLPEKLGFGKQKLDIMFESHFDGLSWDNGFFSSLDHIMIDPFSNSLQYGQEIFEGMKIFKGKDIMCKAFRPLDHYNRFCFSAKRMSMPIVPKELFMKAIVNIEKHVQDILPEDIGKALYLRPFMIASDGDLKIKPATKYSFYIIGTYVDQINTEPVSVYVETELNRTFSHHTGNVKCGGNYGSSFFAQPKALAQNCSQILWLAPDKRMIDEMSSTNVFFIENNELLTPELNDRILPGITRDSIIQIAKRIGMKVREEEMNIDITLDKIDDGIITEAFATGTASTLYSIKNFNYKNQDFILSSYVKAMELKKLLLEYQHRIKTDLF